MTDDELEATALCNKALGCLWEHHRRCHGPPTENLAYQDVEARFGWVSDFDSDSTDDTVIKNLAEALVRTDMLRQPRRLGCSLAENWQAIFGSARQVLRVGRHLVES
jgi:ADP-ribosylglycohydrolase